MHLIQLLLPGDDRHEGCRGRADRASPGRNSSSATRLPDYAVIAFATAALGRVLFATAVA